MSYSDEKFTVDVTREELQKLLLARSSYHEDRAKKKADAAAKELEGKAEEIRNMLPDDDADPNEYRMSGTVENRAKQHAKGALDARKRANYFRFLANHLPVQDTFSLNMRLVEEFELTEVLS